MAISLDEAQKWILGRVREAKDIMYLDNEDEVIAILRFFEWNQERMKDKWFSSDQEKLRVEIGLDYNTKLIEKYKDIDDSRADKNGGLCTVMYCDLDPADEEMRPIALTCGHQFSKCAWEAYLKDKIASTGQACVFTKCQQTRCNVVVPHSLFLELVRDEAAQKYLQWHAKQCTDNNRQMKWCP